MWLSLALSLRHPRKQDHKADYESLQEKKKEGSDKVVGLDRRKALVNKELKQCREAVKEANLYQRYCDELKQTKTLKTLFDAYHLERQMETHARDVEEFEETRKGLDKECTVLEKQMKIKGQEKAQKQKEWATHDQSAQDIEKQIKKIQRNDSLKVQTAIKSAKADMEQSKAEAAKAAERKKEVSRTLKSDEERLSEHEKDLKAEEAANVRRDIQRQGNQVSQYNKLKLKADAETQKAKEAYDRTNREQLQDDRALTQTKEEHLRLQARLQERERQVQNDSGEKNTVSEKLKKLELDKQKLESDLRDSEVKYKQETDHRKVSPAAAPDNRAAGCQMPAFARRHARCSWGAADVHSGRPCRCVSCVSFTITFCAIRCDPRLPFLFTATHGARRPVRV